jgi:hypothetical protein
MKAFGVPKKDTRLSMEYRVEYMEAFPNSEGFINHDTTGTVIKEIIDLIHIPIEKEKYRFRRLFIALSLL